KGTWIFQGRAGLFRTGIDAIYATQVDRLNGMRQKETLVYSPSFSAPLTPVPGSIQVGTVWRFPHSLEQLPAADVQVGMEHEFLHHWMASAFYTWGDDWGVLRSPNVSAPLVGSSIG